MSKRMNTFILSKNVLTDVPTVDDKVMFPRNFLDKVVRPSNDRRTTIQRPSYGQSNDYPLDAPTTVRRPSGGPSADRPSTVQRPSYGPSNDYPLEAPTTVRRPSGGPSADRPTTVLRLSNDRPTDRRTTIRWT